MSNHIVFKNRIYPINQYASIVGCADIREWRVLNEVTGITGKIVYRLFGDALREARNIGNNYYCIERRSGY